PRSIVRQSIRTPLFADQIAPVGDTVRLWIGDDVARTVDRERVALLRFDAGRKIADANLKTGLGGGDRQREAAPRLRSDLLPALIEDCRQIEGIVRKGLVPNRHAESGFAWPVDECAEVNGHWN